MLNLTSDPYTYMTSKFKVSHLACVDWRGCPDATMSAAHRISWLAMGVIALLCLSPIVVAEETCTDQPLAPYKIQYRTTFNGFEITSTRQLTNPQPNSYKLSNKASLFFWGIDEYSLFSLAHGQIISKEYRYDRKGMSNSKDYHIAFNSNTQRIENQLSNDPWTLPYTPNIKDLLNHQEQLRIDVACTYQNSEKKEFIYTIAKQNRVRKHHYRIVKTEFLNTQAGLLKTVKLEKLEENKNRKTEIWLAIDWDFIIARLDYNEKGKRSDTIELLKGTIAGRVIHGLSH